MENKKEYDVELLINGKRVGLNKYVKSVFIEVTMALVDTLKNVEDPQKIALTVEKKS